MGENSLKKSFLKFCEDKKFEKNSRQIEIIDLLEEFKKQKFFFQYFSKSKKKLCFYLYGGVGLGKTMIFDHFYKDYQFSKQRFHFNEFMIQFHNFRHKYKENSINKFVKKLKKNKLIYLDKFQVTNIVDAMILGKLFETIFFENIKVLITSNSKIDDLYKDGLQRERFLPFISMIKKNSLQKELVVDEDYRKLGSNKLQRAFFPINERTSFKINQLFRELTKNKTKEKIILHVKGRKLEISEYYNGIAKFDFTDLCDANLGAEDFIEISNKCKFIVIENIPNFNDENSNQQQRFITLIDIVYEKKIPLMITSEVDLNSLKSSKSIAEPFKRTISRLHELTSVSYV